MQQLKELVFLVLAGGINSKHLVAQVIDVAGDT